MAEVLARKILLDASNHAAPPTSFDQSENVNQGAEPDQEELQNLNKDRGKQPPPPRTPRPYADFNSES